MLKKSLTLAIFCLTSLCYNFSFCNPVKPLHEENSPPTTSNDATPQNTTQEKRKSLGHMDFEEIMPVDEIKLSELLNIKEQSWTVFKKLLNYDNPVE